MRAHELGRVAGIWRYPVKSMAGEPLERSQVDWAGLAGDRRWAFVQESLVRSSFPWLTIREKPELWGYRPRFEDPARPDDSRTLVRTPAGAELDVADPALAAELGGGLRLFKNGRGTFDAFPLSLVTTRSIASLGALVDRALSAQRFRPNLLVEPAGDGAYPEDGWVGATVRVGGLAMRVDLRDQRCVMINVDPETGERDPRVLKAVGRERDACLGVYGTVVDPGAVAVGDPVTLEEA